jgi:hypothetical protein
MSKFINGLNGITADMVKAAALVSAESAKQAAEARSAEKAQLSSKFESFRPVAADKIEKSSRPIERLYAGMAPVAQTEQKEETLAERVAAIKQPPKVVVKVAHEPVPHDSYLLEPKIKLAPKIKRTMEAESVELTDEDKEFLAKLNGDVAEGTEGTTPTTPREKSLAAKAEPKNKITHKDVMVARGVVAKEETEVVEEKEEGTAHEKAEKKKPNAFDWKSPRKAQDAPNRKSGETTSTGHDVKKISTGTVYTKRFEEVEQIEELKDTPGQEHVCAVHVKHSKLGEGKTLFSQHADPAEDGTIAWYDVMFDEGIVRVDTKDLEILEAMSHGNHKKKK